MRILDTPAKIYYYHRNITPGKVRLVDTTDVLPEAGDIMVGMLGLNSTMIQSRVVAVIGNTNGAFEVLLKGAERA